MTVPRPPAMVLQVAVPTPDRDYPVLVGAGVLGGVGHELHNRVPNAGKVALISDDNVMPLYGDRAQQSLRDAGLEVMRLQVPAGEAAKSSAQLVALVEQLIDAGLGRDDAVVALGGGVVGDLAGLAAALCMRGLAVMQVPTSLLAQVDASVGGKTAIDLPAGKNLLGAFHFPVAVCIDPAVLETLPDRELGCGLAEMLKHGAAFDPEHFDAVVDGADAIYARDAAVTSSLVAASVQLKAQCVSGDPRERAGHDGGRAVLNLGHTVGHAIEVASGLELLHGEAVALGLRAAARLSDRQLGAAGLEKRLVAALSQLRLPVELDPWLVGERGAAVERALGKDKKRVAGTVTYIGLEDLGRPKLIKLRPDEILALLRV